MNISKIQQLIDLINVKTTGSPSELAKKLDVTERMTYKYLDILKSEFNAPLKYNRSIKSYVFTEAGEIDLKWQETDKKLNIKRIVEVKPL